MAKLSTLFYRWSRLSRDAEVLASGDPQKMTQRLKNRFKGRLLARLLNRVGFWR